MRGRRRVLRGAFISSRVEIVPPPRDFALLRCNFVPVQRAPELLRDVFEPLHSETEPLPCVPELLRH
jgi:hypothetical protein